MRDLAGHSNWEFAKNASNHRLKLAPNHRDSAVLRLHRHIDPDRRGNLVHLLHQQGPRARSKLSGVSLLNGGVVLLASDQRQTNIRCAVAAFQSRDGVFNAHNVTFDTDVERGGGRGYIDLRNETVNLVMSGEAKSFNILRMNAPITVTRYLGNPKVGVQASVALPQAGIAAALSARVSPVAALLTIRGWRRMRIAARFSRKKTKRCGRQPARRSKYSAYVVEDHSDLGMGSTASAIGQNGSGREARSRLRSPVTVGADPAMAPAMAGPYSVAPIAAMPQPVSATVPMMRPDLDHHGGCGARRGRDGQRPSAEQQGQSCGNNCLHVYPL